MHEAAKLEAGYGPTDAFNLSFEIVSFKANLGGVLLAVNGNMFTDAMRERIQQMKKGSNIILMDLRARMPDGRTLVLPPIVLTVQ